MLKTSASTTKILASVVLVAGAASVAGMGTFGAFTSTTTASETVATGKVVLTSAQHSVLGTTVSAANLVPGDTVQRALTLTRSSDTEAFGSVKLTTTAAAGTASLLTSDTSMGLQMAIDQCTGGTWTKGTGNVLTCAGGTETVVVASRPVIGSAVDLADATTALNAAGAQSELRITLSLPAAADDTFQGKTSTIDFTFDATQRAAQSK
jgi:spore coat-associated protein N